MLLFGFSSRLIGASSSILLHPVRKDFANRSVIPKGFPTIPCLPIMRKNQIVYSSHCSIFCLQSVYFFCFQCLSLQDFLSSSSLPIIRNAHLLFPLCLIPLHSFFSCCFLFTSPPSLSSSGLHRSLHSKCSLDSPTGERVCEMRRVMKASCGYSVGRVRSQISKGQGGQRGCLYEEKAHGRKGIRLIFWLFEGSH